MHIIDNEVLFETPRLRITSVVNNDITTLYENVFSNREVIRYLLDGQCLSLQETQQFVVQHFAQRGESVGFLCIFEKLSDQLIGFCGLLDCDYDQQLAMQKKQQNQPPRPQQQRQFIEFGYALAPQYWGKGYAHEVGLVQIHYASKQWPNAQLFASCHPNNRASIRSVERLSVTYVDTIKHVDRGLRRFYHVTNS
jgi:[ribosomal protein S5]-alanine N-acetyltransferase